LPGPDSPASCYLVEAEGFRLVLDLGNGSLGALQRHIALRDVDAIALSHLHPDHYLDVCSYLVACAHDPAGAWGPVPVHGPAGTAERLAAAYDTSPAGLATRVAVTPWQTRQQIGPFLVTAARVEHPVEAYGLRIEHAGRVLTYSGDTDACTALVDLARACDLLLCEAGFLDGRDLDRGIHLTGRRAGQVAAEAQARRLLLTHIPPWTEPSLAEAAAREVYAGPLERAVSGRTYEV
jgi:ribonuclease BN (tRNA processing enzyme)